MLLKDLSALVFNEGCRACGQALSRTEQAVCHSCLHQLEQTDFFRKGQDNPLYYRFAGKVPLQAAASLFFFDKKGKIQKLLHELKYHEQHEVATFLGKFWAEAWKDSSFFAPYDTLIPIPLHPSKEIQRGFNQSLKIIEGIREQTGLPTDNEVVVRTKKTEAQALKSRTQRWENVADAFQVLKGPPANVVLIDDVITTGATIEACIRALCSHPSPPLTIKVACLATPRGR